MITLAIVIYTCKLVYIEITSNIDPIEKLQVSKVICLPIEKYTKIPNSQSYLEKSWKEIFNVR